jgi:hypothetical protein
MAERNTVYRQAVRFADRHREEPEAKIHATRHIETNPRQKETQTVREPCRQSERRPERDIYRQAEIHSVQRGIDNLKKTERTETCRHEKRKADRSIERQMIERKLHMKGYYCVDAKLRKLLETSARYSSVQKIL